MQTPRAVCNLAGVSAGRQAVGAAPADAMDTIAGADSPIILDAPLWHHWPSGEMLCTCTMRINAWCTEWMDAYARHDSMWTHMLGDAMPRLCLQRSFRVRRLDLVLVSGGPHLPAHHYKFRFGRVFSEQPASARNRCRHIQTAPFLFASHSFLLCFCSLPFPCLCFFMFSFFLAPPADRLKDAP